MIRDGKIYKEMFSMLTPSQRKEYEQRKIITQQFSFSMTDKPLADMPSDCITMASMHVILGLIPWLIKCYRKALRRIEEIEATVQIKGTFSPAMREQIEWSVETANEYELYLTNEIEGLVNVINGHETRLSALVEQMTHHTQMMQRSRAEDEQRY